MHCCAGDSDVKTDGEEVPVEMAQEADEEFVFLEQYPTDKKVENPIIPFIAELSVPIDVGRVIEVEGEILPHANRFSVNLACGSTPMSDVAFHLNPRFDQNHVVRNSRLGGQWGREECLAWQRNPFKRGAKFCLIILAVEDGFMVAVNNYHFCSYAYRTLRIRIQTVQIHGDVTVKSFEYRMTDHYPEIRPDMPHPSVTISHTTPLSDSIQDNVVLPVLGNLPMGLLIGQELEIVGRTKLLPHSFYVNLQNTMQMWPHPDIVLHINPRFQSGAEFRVTVNSWSKGKWGNEHKYPCPFRPGQPFSIKILCKREEYSVRVDGVELCAYRYSSSVHAVNTLYIQGDAFIKEITVS